MRRSNGYKGNFKSRRHGQRQYDGFKNRSGPGSLSNRELYRSRRGVLMGVCRGFADYFNINVFWLRAITLLLLFFSGFWPICAIYIIAGLLLKAEPVSPLRDENDREFYESYTRSRQSGIQRIKKKYENIERRIQRIEDTVTSKDFDWK